MRDIPGSTLIMFENIRLSFHLVMAFIRNIFLNGSKQESNVRRSRDRIGFDFLFFPHISHCCMASLFFGSGNVLL